ncbi:hypothetical protein EAE89_09580 [Photorhabdus heterorhabditis]|nr:hypothetical protein [Photorhabdus heterorhabditis]
MLYNIITTILYVSERFIYWIKSENFLFQNVCHLILGNSYDYVNTKIKDLIAFIKTLFMVIVVVVKLVFESEKNMKITGIVVANTFIVVCNLIFSFLKKWY